MLLSARPAHGKLAHLPLFMQFAIGDNGLRVPASPKERGKCPCCGAPVVAKCGKIVSWHWSHLAKDCDPWYEPESEWHRDWKALFPEDWREVVVGPHRADIKTPKGVIEFQASSISPDEIEERENFYGKMIWVIKADGLDLEEKLSPVARCRYYGSLPVRRERDGHGLLDLLGCSNETDTERQSTLEKQKKRDEEDKIYNNLCCKLWKTAWNTDPMYRWRWPKKSWSFATKKMYLDLSSSNQWPSGSLFRIDWMSQDCKLIKGKHCNKQVFLSRALSL
jgi:hypothetical protein